MRFDWRSAEEGRNDTKYPTTGRRLNIRIGNGTLAVTATCSMALLMCLAIAPVAYASSTTVPATGTFTLTITSETVTHIADGNVILSFTFSEIITGTVSGTRSGTGTLITHSDGTFNAEDTGLFAGTLAGGAPGTITFEAAVSGTFASFKGTVWSEATGKTGGLVGVNVSASVVGAAAGPTTLAGTYSGIGIFT